MQVKAFSVGIGLIFQVVFLNVHAAWKLDVRFRKQGKTPQIKSNLEFNRLLDKEFQGTNL